MLSATEYKNTTKSAGLFGFHYFLSAEYAILGLVGVTLTGGSRENRKPAAKAHLQ